MKTMDIRPPGGRAGSPERLRIAWVGHRDIKLGGGMATYSQELTAALRRRGQEVTFFHHGNFSSNKLPPPDGEARQDSVALASFKIVKPLVLSPPNAKRTLVHRLQRHEFDLVHASFWFSSIDFDLPKLCREQSIPLIATFHVAFDTRPTLWGGIFASTYRVYAPTLAQCDRVIVFSRAQADLLVNLGVEDERLCILPNGVDVTRYCPGPSAGRERFRADRYFLYMGRIDSEKNVDELLQAFLDCQPAAGIRLVIMGSGSDKRRLERTFRHPQVVFTGHIADERDRIDILRGADAFILPSAVEGLSLSMLEAMACGTATVATDVGSDGDALRGAGIVLDPTELASQLRMAIRQLLELPVLCTQLGHLARERVLERFVLDKNLDQLEKIYADVVNNRPAH